MQILVIDTSKRLLGTFGTTFLLGFFGSFSVLYQKNANFGEWTPPNDFGGHLGPNKIEFFCNFGPQKMHILVNGHFQMTFGGIWDKKS